MRREELVSLVQPLLLEDGFELVECSVSRTPRSQTFRVSIDREVGVPVEACARISRRIADLLDANPILHGSYQLEVSSAGMNRPIWSADHFRRFRGERARFELTGSETRTALQGTIGALEGDGVRIRTDAGEEMLLPLARIARANLHMDPWKKRSDPPEVSPAEEKEEASRSRKANRGVGAGQVRKRTRGTGV